MSEFPPLSEADFDEKVLNASLPVLVEFSAVWCGPCRRLEPELDKLAKMLGNRVQCYKVDVDDNPDLAFRYQILSVPTVILFQNGEPRGRINGYQPYPRLLEIFSPYFDS
ncbi:hypothetical protein SE15_02295 [Thermanaerothrix daxensis]|uniref:Thioredoxin n=1 Tax=Thermanaerothrix daxensis TaxID=869279 RepID=A0A0P6Y4T9_9CHLR|nr:thioredoxin domain-containing protein [Thermanaerothrix daxensis]KPL84038.1 hypothetical protein SE15_02295 [Thermanaerothrix daxensis]